MPDTTRDALVAANPAVQALGVPLTTAIGQTLGGLRAIDAVPHAWTDADVTLLGESVVAAVTELELRAALAAARASAARLWAALALNPQMLGVTDAEGRLTDLLPQWLAYTRLAREGATGAG